MKIRRIPKTRRVAFTYDDEQVEMEYNLTKSSNKFRQVEDRMRSKDDLIARQGMVEWLAASITSWNLTDEEDKKLPINKETIEEFLDDFLLLASTEIGKDLQKFADAFPKRRK